MIVDDNIRYRWAVMEILTMDSSIEVVEEASDGYEAVEKVRAIKPDVVLMDLFMPNFNGLEATLRIREEMPDVRILINTISDQEVYLHAALEAGASGYLLKNDKPELFVHAIHHVANGGTILSRSMADQLQDELRTRQASIEGVPSSFPDEPGEEADATDREKRLEEQTGADISEPSDVDAELVSTAPTMELDNRLTFVQLVVSPPLDTSVFLNLHQLINEIPTASVESIKVSLSEDTLLNVVFNSPFPLLRRLSELPFVAKMETEPYTEDIRTPPPTSTGSNQVGLENPLK